MWLTLPTVLKTVLTSVLATLLEDFWKPLEATWNFRIRLRTVGKPFEGLGNVWKLVGYFQNRLETSWRVVETFGNVLESCGTVGKLLGNFWNCWQNVANGGNKQVTMQFLWPFSSNHVHDSTYETQEWA